MSEAPQNTADIDDRIATVRENIRGLIEQAAGTSGAADDELIAQRIAEQQALLDRLTKQRDQLRQQKS
jgi:hypothetical protein